MNRKNFRSLHYSKIKMKFIENLQIGIFFTNRFECSTFVSFFLIEIKIFKFPKVFDIWHKYT